MLCFVASDCCGFGMSCHQQFHALNNSCRRPLKSLRVIPNEVYQPSGLRNIDRNLTGFWLGVTPVMSVDRAAADSGGLTEQ